MTAPTSAQQEDLRLHLGCGPRYIPGFCHVDIRPLPHVEVVTSVDALGMFADSSASLVYASHVLEHFGRHQVASVLREWFRVLKPQGILRLSVPDFDQVIKIYHQASNDIDAVLGALVGRQDYETNFHYMVFNYGKLTALLLEAGFSQVRRWDWRVTEHCSVDDYSQAYYRAEGLGEGIQVSLNLEAVK